jgi:hypothetical protein
MEMMMNKKAYLVDFSIRTRVIAPDGLSEENIIEIAVDKLLDNRKMIEEKLRCGCEEVEEDYEVPYDSTDENDLKGESK